MIKLSSIPNESANKSLNLLLSSFPKVVFSSDGFCGWLFVTLDEKDWDDEFVVKNVLNFSVKLKNSGLVTVGR